jgi:serine phosphatase RsbU (regulator of sigma subunit)
MHITHIPSKQLTYKLYFLILIFFLYIPSSSSAQNILTINNEAKKYTLGPYMEILEDRQKKLTIKDIQSGNFDNLFKKSDQAVPSFGITESAFWCKFRLSNESDIMTSWLLVLEYPLMDSIEIYLPRGNTGEYSLVKTGYSFPFSSRVVKHRNFIFPLGPLSQDPCTYYMRVENSDRLEMPLTLWQERSFWAHDHVEQYVLGIYYGIIIVMVLYNLFVFFTTRLRSYLYYVLYISAFCLFMLTQNGIAYEFIFPAFLYRYSHYIPELQCILIFTGILFVQSFLNTRSLIPRFNVLLNVMKVLFVICITLPLVVSYSASIAVVVALSIAGILATFTAGVLCLMKKSRPAMFLMTAWTAMLVGGIVYGFKIFALLPNNFFTNYALSFGSATAVTLLSIGIGDMINNLKNELQVMNEELENKVRDRTEELETAMEELEAINSNLIETQRVATIDMKMASNIQATLFPKKAPLLPEWDTAFTFKPMAGVSGDLYDFYIRDDQLAGIVIADVSGHGIASGLITMIARSVFFRNFNKRWGEPLSAVVDKINHDMINEIGTVNNYLTGIIIRIRDDTIEYVNAGHTELLCRKVRTGRVNIVGNEDSQLKGLFIGSKDMEMPYNQVSFGLEKGDVLLMYTDGITECFNGDDEQYGENRLIAALESAPQGPSNEIINHILDDFNKFIKYSSFNDDVTLIVAKYI